MLVPLSRAICSAIAQLEPSALNPPAVVAPSDSMPTPCRPAARAPVGETWLATAISTEGREYGVICNRAWSSVNQSVFLVTVSPRSSGTSTSSASSIMSRCLATSMPIMTASDGSAPGPTPNITRPRVTWSSWLIRSASISG